MSSSTLALPISHAYCELLPVKKYLHVGKFERLPKWLNCIPLIVQWLWLSFRYGSISLPSAANPYITCGGLVGEGKQEYFNCMGSFGKRLVAPYVLVATQGEYMLEKALTDMKSHNISFPVVAKPDVGWCGYGVKRIDDKNALATYLNHFPKNHTILLQTYLPEAGEAGIFYVRHPKEATGKIIGILLRYYPQIIGDGVHTIAQLIARNVRLQRLVKNKLHKADYDPRVIPAPGEEVRLSLIGSTRIGGIYRDGSDTISSELTGIIDNIAKDMPEFYVGRFDIRYENLEELRQGKGFTIMEVNGAGSEAVHAWDPKYSISEAYRIIFAKQRLLFQIAACNRKKGYKPIGLLNLAKLHFSQQSLIKRYPLSN